MKLELEFTVKPIWNGYLATYDNKQIYYQTWEDVLDALILKNIIKIHDDKTEQLIEIKVFEKYDIPTLA